MENFIDKEKLVLRTQDMNGRFAEENYKVALLEVFCDIRDVLIKILYKN